MNTETIQSNSMKQSGYEQFLIVKTDILKKNNRSEHSFNRLDKATKKMVIKYAQENIASLFNDNDIAKKNNFREFSTPQKMALIDAMNDIKKAFSHIPRWLSETDAL